MNFRNLSDSQINELEAAILSKKFIPVSDPREPSISVQYYDSGYELWKRFNDPNTPIGAYDIFASNGMRYTCYALYKSKSNQIYIIHISMDDISWVYEINKNKFWFLFRDQEQTQTQEQPETQ
jgi:hypothetical protein